MRIIERKGERRPVRTRQESYLAGDGADLVVPPPADPASFVRDHAAHVIVLEVLQRLLDVLLPAAELRVGRAELRHDVLLDLRELPVPLVLRVFRVGLAHALVHQLAHLLRNALGERHLFEGALLLADRAPQLFLLVEELVDGALPEEQRLDHRVLVDLFRPALDHEDRVAGGGHHHVDVALLTLELARVGDEFPAHAPDPHAREHEGEGDVRERQRERRAGQREHVGVVLVVRRKDRRDDLRLVLVALGKERAAAPVDEPGDQRLALGQASLAAEEATRNATRGGEALLVVDREREEIEPFAPVLRRDSGDEHHAVTGAHHHRTI